MKFGKYRKMAFPISFFSLRATNFVSEKEHEERRKTRRKER